MTEIIGILLVVQGVGGFLNRILGSEGPSWFVQLHLLQPALHIPVSIAMAVLGIAMSGTRAVRGRSGE